MNDHNTATVRTTWSLALTSLLAYLAHVVFGVEIETSDPLIILIVPAVAGIVHRLSLVLSEKVPYFGYVLFGINRSPEYTTPPPAVPALADEGRLDLYDILIVLAVVVLAIAVWVGFFR